MNMLSNDERKSIYQDYRTAKKHLKAGRDFADWLKVARGYDQARREAMLRAGGINQPQGAAYREAFALIDRREKLIDRDDNGKEFPSKEDRTYCIKLLENYDVPSIDPRRPSIKAWRDSLSVSERSKLNHPKNVWQAYWAKTEPMTERQAKLAKQREPKPDPLAEALADSEAREHEARRDTETLRELLGHVLDALGNDLPADLREAIRRALA
jgi:hypothetical protein